MSVTGYKPHEIGIFGEKHKGIYYIKKALMKEIFKQIEEGLEWILISGQLGVELWAAEVVFALQETFPHIKLAILTPYLDQEKNWKEDKQEYYHSILAQADFVESIHQKPYENPGQLKRKNEFLIGKSEGLLLLYDEDTPGTPRYILEEAKKKEKREAFSIIRITPEDIQHIVEDEQLADSDFST
jgi:uncharacterized phage-like protein YoqJ